MISKSQTQIVITIAVVVFAIMLLIDGVALKTSYLRPYSVAVGVAGLGTIAYDRWCWRWPLLQKLSKHPDLRGTWRGTLQSDWKDPKTKAGIPPIEVYLAIEQSFSTISPRLLTAESASEPVASALAMPAAGPALVWTTYVNEPQLPLQDVSRTHRGAMKIEVHGSSPTQLIGTYWTDRNTSGRITFERRSKQCHTSFDAAAVDSYS